MRISLDSYGEKTGKVLAGREKGEEVRDKLDLEKMDQNSEPVEVAIPGDVYSMNTSYFLGLFGPSVRTLGEAGFEEKYTFICDKMMKDNIDDGISRALKEADVLGAKNEKKKH
jgi:hypothetical protein